MKAVANGIKPCATFVQSSSVPPLVYDAWQEKSRLNPNQFWAEQAKRLDWFETWHTVSEQDFKKAYAAWFLGGKLNACYNCVDRHAFSARRNQAAIIWEADNPEESKTLTYWSLYQDVCKAANVLKGMGVKKGSRVVIYLPMVPELAISVLACARIGAIHSVVFGGFSAQALASRIEDCNPTCVITADGSFRGGKAVPVKPQVDEARVLLKQEKLPCLVVKRTHGACAISSSDIIWQDAMKTASTECTPEIMDAEDPLFILYTSGSTGKPKGVVHTTAGYLLYAAFTHAAVFDLKETDTFWCTADIGWITGHSYVLYGPLANGATTVMYEGVISYPDVGRIWDIIDKHYVTTFYTAPTLLRSLAKEGDGHIEKRKLSSLRLLGSVGEPINPEIWQWFHRVIGKGRCPIVDTWWQTETGGILISPLPAAVDCKPGSATLPFFGVHPVLLDDHGREIRGPGVGNLCIAQSWPGQMRGLWQDPERYKETYFSAYPGYYFTADGCRRDQDGYYWITGRIDDVINVSGHRLGTAEIESALVLHPQVAEAAVVGIPDDIKGQAIYAFVTLKTGFEATEVLKQELLALVRKQISAIAVPKTIHWAPALPKTRSGKIMRRLLRKVATRETKDLGDTSTLADPIVIQALLQTLT